jgi:hypothetical protein
MEGKDWTERTWPEDREDRTKRRTLGGKSSKVAMSTISKRKLNEASILRYFRY